MRRFVLAQKVTWPGGWRVGLLGRIVHFNPETLEPTYQPLLTFEYTGREAGALFLISLTIGYRGEFTLGLPTTIDGLVDVGPGFIHWESYAETSA